MKRTCFLLAALLAACALPSGHDDDANLAYDADRASYARTDAVSTSLVNTSDQTAGYNLCVNVLEKRGGGGFRRVERTPEHPCALVLFTLHPGEVATFQEPASAFPGPGTYRLRTTVETPVSGRRVDVVTEAFVVTE
jgi:hypothetical protein